MRREELPLIHIIEHADRVAGIIAGMTENEFIQSEIHHSAVTYHLAVIGEAVSRIPQAFLEQHPDVPWRRIKGFRNYVMHMYDQIDWSLVWSAAKESAPQTRDSIWAILDSEYPGAVRGLRERGH